MRSGKLAPYVNNNLGVYKCPSDLTVAQNGPRLRSISMNSLVGDPLINPNRFNPTWVQFLKMSQFPGPTHFYVFIEEHPDTINDGYFMNRWDAIQWGNVPASWHNRAANISWADGHLERHRWIPDTARPPGPRRRWQRRLCSLSRNRLPVAARAHQRENELKGCLRAKAPKPQSTLLERSGRPCICSRPRLRHEIKNPAIAVDDLSAEPGCNSWNRRAAFDVH